MTSRICIALIAAAIALPSLASAKEHDSKDVKSVGVLTAFHRCPVTGNPILEPDDAVKGMVGDKEVLLCCKMCKKGLKAEMATIAEQLYSYDPISMKEVTITPKTTTAKFGERTFYFEKAENKVAFDKTPQKFAEGYDKYAAKMAMGMH